MATRRAGARRRTHGEGYSTSTIHNTLDPLREQSTACIQREEGVAVDPTEASRAWCRPNGRRDRIPASSEATAADRSPPGGPACAVGVRVLRRAPPRRAACAPLAATWTSLGTRSALRGAGMQWRASRHPRAGLAFARCRSARLLGLLPAAPADNPAGRRRVRCSGARDGPVQSGNRSPRRASSMGAGERAAAQSVRAGTRAGQSTRRHTAVGPCSSALVPTR